MKITERIKELICKLLSIKGLFAIVITVLTLIYAWPAYYVFVAWLVFIFGREAFKLVSLIKKGE